MGRRFASAPTDDVALLPSLPVNENGGTTRFIEVMHVCFSGYDGTIGRT